MSLIRNVLQLTMIGCFLVGMGTAASQAQSKQVLYCVSQYNNDLISLLQQEQQNVIQYRTLKGGIDSVPKNQSLLILAQEYPQKIDIISKLDLAKIRKKNLKVYAEYVSIASDSVPVPEVIDLERVVVSNSSYFKNLPNMALLSVNGSYFLPTEVEDPLLVVAKVAGFDKAIYGLENTPSRPLLYQHDKNILVATTALSHFAQARFMPEQSWKDVWESILGHLTQTDFKFDGWLTYVSPAYGKNELLDQKARLHAVQHGINWFFNGHFLIDPSWEKDWVDKYMGDGAMPIGPELPADSKDGEGTHGVLEGHCSYIYYDGKQKYRYWLRNDVQGESSMAFALAGKLLRNSKYDQIASNLSDFSFERFRQGSRNDPASPTFGLLSWAVTNPGVYYADDNARSLLGTITAASLLDEDKWNEKIIEALLANFRTTGRMGFRGDRLEEADIQKNGWEYYWNREYVNPHPHFEAWPWACYLWLYDRTGYAPLLERTKIAIRKTMEAYPNQWGWTNGIQQERARMLLPLAWLVRVEPTDEHKAWLDLMVGELLKNQVESGGIREELGDPSTGMFGKTKSNDDYGKHEAPLIFNNGDPIADMLYTTNFAFIGLNEAVKATDNPQYKEALLRMSDFLTRIQVRSEHFKNVDGAWFRAFNYENWDYWASNADAGWGAWSTLTGWIQSWIVSTQALIEMDSSLWDVGQGVSLEKDWEQVKIRMFPTEIEK